MRTQHAMKRHRSGKIAAGSILLAVHTEDGEERSRVKDIFERHHGEDIGTSGEARAA